MHTLSCTWLSAQGHFVTYQPTTDILKMVFQIKVKITFVYKEKDVFLGAVIAYQWESIHSYLQIIPRSGFGQYATN